MDKRKIAGLVTGGLGMANDALINGASIAELPENDYQENINDLNGRDFTAGSYEDLANLMNATSLAKTDYTTSDVLGMSDGAAAGQILGNTFQGAMSGLSAGGMTPAGGIMSGIGAGLQLLSSGIGYAIRKNKASNQAQQLNYNASIANQNAVAKMEKSAMDIGKNIRNMEQLNIAALGGPLDTTFTNGVRFITEGGSHSQNPLGGIPQGIASDGIPNLVEEGEVIYNDYVYSKRLKIPQADKELLGLKKDKEYTYADAAKQIQKESEERPNDPISRRNLEEMMGRLQGSQEALKEKRDGQALKRAVNKMTPDELAMFMQQMQQPQQMQPMAGMQSMQPMQPTQSEVPMFAKGGILGHIHADPFTDANGANLTTNVNPLLIPVQNNVSYIPPTIADIFNNKLNQAIKSDSLPEDITFETPVTDIVSPIKIAPKPYTPPEALSGAKKSNDTNDTNNTRNNNIAQALRAAPIIGSIGTTIASLFDKPNYSNIARAERAAASVPRVSATPIGQRMSYTPIDINYIATQQANNALGARRALAEYGAGNPAGVQQAQIANNYANQTALGQAIMQAGQLNRQNLAQALEFNRQTDSANAASNLQAALANQQRDANYANFLLQTGQLRDEEMRRIQAARSANITNLFNNIGNLGSDMLSRQMVKAGMDAGVFGNYGTNNAGPYGELISDLFTQMAQQYMKGKNKSNKKEE